MSWRDAVLITVIVTLANVAGILWSTRAKLVVWLFYILAGLLVISLASWRTSRRIKSVAKAPDHEQEAMLATLTEAEQALARLSLDLVSVDQIWKVPVEGQVFGYQQTPTKLRALIVGICVLLSGVFLAVLMLTELPYAERLSVAGLCFGFALAPLIFSYLHEAESQKLIVTSFGLVHQKANGGRTGILWSELAWIRDRRFRMMLELYSADGRRRIRVWYTLLRFPEFVELVVSAVKWIDERASESAEH